MEMSSLSLVAWAFALSPFPAYLPQYFSLMRKCYTENENNNDTHALLRSYGSENALVEDQVITADDRGIDSLRKRNTPNHLQDSSSAKAGLVAPPHSAGLHIIPGSPSKLSHFEHSDIHNGSTKITGLSRATVFVLLSAHLLRMLYFYGLTLEKERMMLNAGDSVTPSYPTETTDKVPDVQWDLVGQSVSMIFMQLLLLRATTKIRKESEHYHDDTTTQAGGDWQSLSKKIKAHFRRLLSPYKILKSHSIFDYLELLFLSSITTKLMFDNLWYPRYRMRVVDTLKHTSIVLESCLALPQAIRNYSQGTTDGLNAIMVGGWVIGDFLKLFYFSLNLLWSRITGLGDDGNIVFVFGCIFALALDFLVCFQMAFWYQSRETLELKEGLRLSIQKLKASHHRANESLPCKLIRCVKEAKPSSP